MIKCIQFQLPNGAGGIAAQMAVTELQQKINNLKETKKIGRFKITYESFYKMNVWFKDERDVTMFLLVWEITTGLKKATVVEKNEDEDPFIEERKREQ